MAPNEVRTRVGVSRVDADGILHVIFLPGVEQTLADAQDFFRAGAELRAGRRWPILVDLRRTKTQDRDVRKYYGSPEVSQTASVMAVLVSSSLSRLTANLFITLTKPSAPTRMFTDETEACEWLKGFMD
jgi:hypothetical protein